MTLFPDAVDAMMNASIIGRAQERGFVTIRTHQIREFTTNRQMQVDDYPYGGGRGAVMQADPLYRCWQHICDEAGGRVHTIYMSPCGRVLTQQVARELTIISFWCAATTRVWTSGFWTSAWTRRSPWATSW